jgi:hypothetical protein
MLLSVVPYPSLLTDSHKPYLLSESPQTSFLALGHFLLMKKVT